jgi:hypothetical protein
MSRRTATLALAAGVALLLAVGCGGTRMVTQTVTAPAGAAGGLGAPREQALFGHIRSLRRNGDHYELRFDPAWYLSGETANVAAAEDGAVPPGEPVPNDNYRLDEGHRLLTYVVPTDAHVTVLTRKGDPAQLGATPITVAQLARIVAGHTPSGIKLFESLESGVWIRVRIDTVRAIDQQYQP